MRLRKRSWMSLAVASLVTLASAATAAGGQAKSNQFWWPDQVDLGPLRQHDEASNPYGPDFDYRAEFQTLDLDAVERDIEQVLTTSQD